MLFYTQIICFYEIDLFGFLISSSFFSESVTSYTLKLYFNYLTFSFCFLTITKFYLTKKFDMKMYTWFSFCSKNTCFEDGTCGSSWSLWRTQPLFILVAKLPAWWYLFPGITTILILFCCPLVAVSTHWSIPRFVKG